MGSTVVLPMQVRNAPPAGTVAPDHGSRSCGSSTTETALTGTVNPAAAMVDLTDVTPWAAPRCFARRARR
jgi:hypothetical protein